MYIHYIQNSEKMQISLWMTLKEKIIYIIQREICKQILVNS